MPDPTPCPKCPYGCGAEIGAAATDQEPFDTFVCGTFFYPSGKQLSQSDRCRIACLERDLAAARASIAELQEMVSDAESRANERGRERDALAAEVGRWRRLVRERKNICEHNRQLAQGRQSGSLQQQLWLERRDECEVILAAIEHYESTSQQGKGGDDA